MCGTVSSDSYGALSLAVAARGKAEIMRIVGSRNFTPPPKVDSAVVRITPERQYDPKLSKVIRTLFSMRRKTAVNNLCAKFPLEKESCKLLLQQIAENPLARAEDLDLEKVVALRNALEKQGVI
jgi:16S rRNA (adenine1518-N6/adenine1519-N6)-dimethyltransferase